VSKDHTQRGVLEQELSRGVTVYWLKTKRTKSDMLKPVRVSGPAIHHKFIFIYLFVEKTMKEKIHLHKWRCTRIPHQQAGTETERQNLIPKQKQNEFSLMRRTESESQVSTAQL